MKPHLYALLQTFALLVGSVIASVLSSFIIGTLVWVAYNTLLVGFFSPKPITFLQSVGLVLVVDLLSRPSSKIGPQLSSDLTATSDPNFISTVSDAGAGSV